MPRRQTRTQVEEKIHQDRKRRGILLPWIEKYFDDFSGKIESVEDANFLFDLMMKMSEREARRNEEIGHYSPSSLGEKCVRKAFFARHAKLDRDAPSPYSRDAHQFFITGNFMHLRWHFTFYKMEKWIANSSIFRVYGYEIPVESKHGDHQGTIDLIVFIYNVPYVIDLKGLNQFTAKKAMYGKVSRLYRMQVADYLVLWNAQKDVPFKISNGVLLIENKANGHLDEIVVTLARYGRKVRKRLNLLRDFEARKEIPSPLCRSINETQFQQCQFRNICWDEVNVTHHEHSERVRTALARPEVSTTDRVVKALRAKSKRKEPSRRLG